MAVTVMIIKKKESDKRGSLIESRLFIYKNSVKFKES